MPRISVVVVSHGRADALIRCLSGISQLDIGDFEVVVVCDSAAAAHVDGSAFTGRVKRVVFDQPNISAARNLGIAEAVGEIVAFIDDDAVPEPTWLTRLTAPFADGGVSAVGGYVLGRNGVSYQWRGSTADAAGRSFSAPPGTPLPVGHVWRTEGTNMAFRRDGLVACGGFDEAFAFFLDETDLNRRIDGETVIVPEALVHHGFAPSARRRTDRVPRDLTQIAASATVFLSKHAPDQMAQRIGELRQSERARLLRHMVAGRLEPRDVTRLMAGFEAGLMEGAARRSRYLSDATASVPFLPFRKAKAGPPVLLSGSGRDKPRLLHDAEKQVADGKRPTVIIFHRDARYLQVSFDVRGFWLHEGGQFGRGLRDEPLLRWASLDQRIAAEARRIAPIRGAF